LRSARFPLRSIGFIAAGGAAGTVARAAVERALPVGNGGFPFATLAINLGGSMVLGLLIGALDRAAPSPYPRLLLGTGLCGGFTTFSTFSVETDSLLRAGRIGVAIVYAVVSVSGGLLSAFAGMRIARLRRRMEV
jgi:CrcB protein